MVNLFLVLICECWYPFTRMSVIGLGKKEDKRSKVNYGKPIVTLLKVAQTYATLVNGFLEQKLYQEIENTFGIEMASPGKDILTTALSFGQNPMKSLNFFLIFQTVSIHPSSSP